MKLANIDIGLLSGVMHGWRNQIPKTIVGRLASMCWRLIEALVRSDRRVQELVQLVGEPTNLVSYPLRQLRSQALVNRGGHGQSGGTHGDAERPAAARLEALLTVGWNLLEGAIHERSRDTYGAPRIHAELHAWGELVSRKRVTRLMREAGLRGASLRRPITTTVRDAKIRPAPDLVKRDFAAEGRDRLWVANIT